MPTFTVAIDSARKLVPEYKFLKALTPSAQKAAFHVQDSDGRDLCLKIISPNVDPTDMVRIQREIKAMHEIVHAGVARFVDYEFTSRNGVVRHFTVEEFIDGADLTHVLGTPWPLKKAVAFFLELAHGLGAIHAKQIIHRDLKPSNIRVKTSGAPVIIDFGMSRHLALPDITQTFEGAQIGTPAYFAPEQWRNTKREIDERTDLFAFGVIMHTALVGSHPFMDGRPLTRQTLEAAICDSHDYQNKAAFAKLPDEVKTLVKWLLGKNRSDRPRYCEQIIEVLNKLSQGVK